MSRCECEHCGDNAEYYLVSDYENYRKYIGMLAKLCNRCSSTTLYPGVVSEFGK
jgi:NAD-dependent SIR2 family protein deacetylase